MAKKKPRPNPGQRQALAPRSRTQSLVRPGSRTTSPKTKVLLVRQPVRSTRDVRSSTESGTGLRLAIGTLAALGVLAVIWGIGHIGYRLGFAPIVRVPAIDLEPTGGLATGIMMLVHVPLVVLETGIAHPMWLMAGFMAIALPAAGLSAARPRVPGGPRPAAIVVAFAIIGAIAAAANGVLLVWWSASPFRAELMQPLPFLLERAAVTTWAADLQVAAGLDVLAFTAGAIWIVLAWRLPNPHWLRALTVSVTIFAAAVALVSMSASSAAAVQIHRGRSVCLDPGAPPGDRLLLGTTAHREAMLRVDGTVAAVTLGRETAALEVIGTQSVVDFLVERTGE